MHVESRQCTSQYMHASAYFDCGLSSMYGPGKQFYPQNSTIGRVATIPGRGKFPKQQSNRPFRLRISLTCRQPSPIAHMTGMFGGPIQFCTTAIVLEKRITDPKRPTSESERPFLYCSTSFERLGPPKSQQSTVKSVHQKRNRAYSTVAHSRDQSTAPRCRPGTETTADDGSRQISRLDR